jgi:SAM-dependent methyltransferase
VTDRVVDRSYLTGVQYASDANLAARQAIYRFRQPPGRAAPWALDLAGLRSDERVLDVGCGNGLYLEELAERGHRGVVVGMDLSRGMLVSTRGRNAVPVAVADAQHLPYASDAFDCVLAMHMLYHVPDRSLATSEITRVLRTRGVALFVTNSVRHLEELNALLNVAGGDVSFERAYARFSSESGARELGRHFATVERHDMRGELVVTEVQPIVDYAASGWALTAAPDDRRASVLREVERRVTEIIAAEGAFRIRTDVGCFVCR